MAARKPTAMERLRRPARMEFLHELLEFIDAGAKRLGFDESARGRIRLASEEALVNVILHAYAGADGEVEAGLSGGEDRSLRIEIRDRGAAFDPLAEAEPDLEAGLADRKIGGLGIFFIREAADRAAYRREGEENILTLYFIRT